MIRFNLITSPTSNYTLLERHGKEDNQRINSVEGERLDAAGTSDDALPSCHMLTEFPTLTGSTQQCARGLIEDGMKEQVLFCKES